MFCTRKIILRTFTFVYYKLNLVLCFDLLIVFLYDIGEIFMHQQDDLASVFCYRLVGI